MSSSDLSNPPHSNDSYVQRLSASNDPPELEELEAIMASLAHPRQEYDAVSLQLVQLQVAMDYLQAQQRGLRAEIQPLLAITSPIRRLPDDILQEIFLACLPSGHYPILDPRHAPLLLTHICRRWRFVAHDTRRLWTAIHIPLPMLHTSPQSTPIVYVEGERSPLKAQTAQFGLVANAFLTTVKEWVARIGGCGLSFTIVQEDNQRVEEDSCLQALFHILLRCVKQWEHAGIAVPLRSVGCVVDLRAEDVPALKSLSICSTSRHGLPSQDAGFPDIFGAGQGAVETLPSWSRSRIFEAPKLDSVSLRRIDEPLQSMSIGWAKLTSLGIEMQGAVNGFGYLHQGLMIDIPVLVAILRQCRLLRDARLALTPGAPDPASNHDAFATPLHLPNLEALALFEDRSCSSSLFTILEAPRLTNLEFHTLRKPNPATIAHGMPTFSILPFLRRHGSKIEKLALDTRFVLPGERVKIWETVTSLRSLRLAPSTFSSVMYPGDEQNLLTFTNCDLHQFVVPVTSGAFPGGSNVVMPNLRSIECSTLSTLTDRGVLEFLSDRKLRGLRRALLSYEKDWDPVENFMDEVISLQESMDVILEKKSRPRFLQPRKGLKVRCNATL